MLLIFSTSEFSFAQVNYTLKYFVNYSSYIRSKKTQTTLLFCDVHHSCYSNNLHNSGTRVTVTCCEAHCTFIFIDIET